MDVSIDRNPDASVTLAVPQPDTKRSKPGDDISLKIEKPAQMVAKKPPLPPRPPPPPAARLPPPAPPSVMNEYRQTFEEFANPRKLKPATNNDFMGPPGSDISSLHESDDDGGAGDDDDPSEYSVDEPAEPDEEPEYMRPSPGFHTLDEEKASLIFKLARAKRAGMPSTRNFSMSSDIRELRGEMARIDHELALDASLKFQRKMMMMTVSVMEHLNTRFDPFDIQLNGWSETVHSSINDYDRVFERLHDKYKSKVSMAPEIELLFMVGGSAMMFHFTKTVFKQGLPGIPANPELMASMMKAFTQAQPQKPPKKQEDDDEEDDEDKEDDAPPPPKHDRREMRGPQMDLGGILGGLGSGGGAMPFPPMGPPRIANAPKKTVSFAPGTKRPRADDEDERLSDIVSDIDSIPDDLSSFGSDTSEEGNIRNVPVKGKGKKAKIVMSK